MTKTKFEVMDICNAQDIPVGPILSMKELAEEPSLRKPGPWSRSIIRSAASI
jgi:formyl-CoA transferase